MLVMMSFSAATEELQDFLSQRGRSDLTIRAYKTDLKMFWQEMELTEINLNDLERIAAQWLNKYRHVVGPKTTGRRLTTMRNLGLVYDREILKKYSAPTPARSIPHPLPKGTKDLKRLLDVCNSEEHKLLIAMCGLLGMRVSEARNARSSDFDFAHQIVTIVGKGHKVRKVPISPYAWSLLLPMLVRAHLERDGQLVGMSDRTARALITNLGTRAGIDRPISSHDLRATFGTEAYQHSKDLRAVQELLGHASPQQTQLYTGISQDAMRHSASFMEDE